MTGPELALVHRDDLVEVWHGDALEHPDLWTGCGVLIIDPPYGREWRQGEIRSKGRVDTNNSVSTTGIANDHDTSTRDRALELWGTDKPAIVFGDLMLPPPPNTKLVCVYHKADGTAGMRGARGGVRRDCEAIYLVGNGWSNGIGGRSSLFTTRRQVSANYGIVAKNGGHPHTKPDDVLGELIDLTDPDATIADPFTGSGSVLVAAKTRGRHAVGIEIDPKYAALAARRCAQDALAFPT